MISKNNEILAITQNQYEQSVTAYAMAARSDLTLSDFITPRQKMTVNDGVARIHISGALTDQAPPIHEVAGGTDYRSLRSEIAEAKSQGVESIIYVINSGGGSVQGLKEASDDMKSSGIPSTSYVDGMAASAAYYLAASADGGIVSTPSSINGNIGTILAWTDASEAMEAQGVESVAITNDGADLKSIGKGTLTESQTEFLQEQVDEMGAEFKEHVLAARPNIDPEVFRAGWYQGDRALALNLVDQVGVLS